MIELKQINRNYGKFNFKFIPTDFKGGRKHDKLWLSGKYQEAKDVYIKYCENRLHFIATYIELTRFYLPIIFSSILLISFNNENITLFIASIMLLILNIIIHNISKKWWWIMCVNYSWSITGIDTDINEKYGIFVNTDFDDLGVKYLNGEL